MTKERYLEMMEQMGAEPKEEEIPPDSSDFLSDTLTVFEINGHLRDIWDGMSGSYMGKDFSTLPILFDIYEITNKDNQLLYLRLLNIIISENINIVGQKIKQEQKKHKK